MVFNARIKQLSLQAAPFEVIEIIFIVDITYRFVENDINLQ